MTYDRDMVRLAFMDLGNALRESLGDSPEPSHWVEDVAHMHVHFRFGEAVSAFDASKLGTLLAFRARFLREEMDELDAAISDRDAEGVVDALIDLCVVAIGTLDLFSVDARRAWNAVHDANMSKAAGVKPGRPNPLGLPDLVKPESWVAPSHEGNHGTIQLALDGMPDEGE